jgi:hypothetical protein
MQMQMVVLWMREALGVVAPASDPTPVLHFGKERGNI